jgi:hypothetical protein
MRWPGDVAYSEGKRATYRFLWGKPERKRPLGRPGRRWTMFKKNDGRTWIYVVMSSNRWRVVVDRVMKL